VRRVDQADDPVLDEISDINRVRHGRGNATGELLDERDTGYNAGVLSRDLRAHQMSSGASIGNRGTKWQSLGK